MMMAREGLDKKIRIHAVWLRGRKEGTRADLSRANLSEADLRWANLSWANLSEANLSRAVLPFGADIPNLFTQILEKREGGGKLDMGNWHYGTTHCLAGWVVTIAGEAGQVAEALLGTNAAAALIITQSCPYLGGVVPDFFASNEKAMEFIRECAAKEAGQ